MLRGIALVAVFTAGPLLMVWKQVYITSTSWNIEHMTDSLTVLNREIATLRLQCEHLSSNRRIEKIARRSFGLDYPSSDQIVIVRVPDKRLMAQTGWSHDLFVFLRKSLFGDRG
jgi:cell division protein FtsL